MPAIVLCSATNDRVPRRPDDDAATRQALADVVVRVALEPQRDAGREERAERLPGRADEREVDGAVGQALAAVAPGDLLAEHRAHGAVDVAHRQLGADRPAGLERLGSQLDELVVERAVETVVLRDRTAPRSALRQVGDVEDRAQVEAARLPVVDGPRGVEHLGVADRLLEGAEAELGEQLAHLLGDVREERLDELGLSGEALAQLGVLRRDTDRAGVEVADAHHDAAAHHERRRGEAVLLRARAGRR